eukprot:CAMPEP_0194525366 /NCGR_PEP_ID=MMETSP0253-20130528/60814_1 /TAXON_ID=2966 /ORGANISM="Noctiluca scintillans" /LENGTH=524 /DNA_ID=CAMNT_0039370087 /DNA_START=44 /DNA_END=1619 /DNA_ORIENTATION=+
MASTPAHGSNQEAAKDTSRRFKTFQSMHFQGAFGNVCVSKHPIFQGRDPNFIEMLISEFMIELYAEGDVILKQGALGDSMYFLNRGSVEVLTSRMEQVSVLKEGSVFGEMSCLGSASRRTCTVRALEFCDCRSIARWSFRSLLKRFPEEQLFFTKLCDERYKKLNEVKERRRPRATVEFAMLCQEPSVCGYRSVLPLGGGTERGAVTSSCVHGELPLRGSLSGVTEPSRRGRSEAHTERSRRGRSEAQTEPSLRGRSEAQFQRPDSVSGSSGSDTSQASDQSWKYETRRTGSLRSRRHDCVQDSPIDGRPAGCVSETAEATDGHRSSSWDCERSSSDVAKADGYQSSWRARAHSAEASRLKLMLKSVMKFTHGAQKVIRNVNEEHAHWRLVGRSALWKSSLLGATRSARHKKGLLRQIAGAFLRALDVNALFPLVATRPVSMPRERALWALRGLKLPISLGLFLGTGRWLPYFHSEERHQVGPHLPRAENVCGVPGLPFFGYPGPGGSALHTACTDLPHSTVLM